jgi:hypothetical protein
MLSRVFNYVILYETVYAALKGRKSSSLSVDSMKN